MLSAENANFLRGAAALHFFNQRLVQLVRPAADLFISTVSALPLPMRSAELAKHHTANKKQAKCVADVASGAAPAAAGCYDLFSYATQYGAPRRLEEWDGTVWCDVIQHHAVIKAVLPEPGHVATVPPPAALVAPGSYLDASKMTKMVQQLRSARNACCHLLFMSMDSCFLHFLVELLAELLAKWGDAPAAITELRSYEAMAAEMLPAQAVQRESTILALQAQRLEAEHLRKEFVQQLAAGVDTIQQFFTARSLQIEKDLQDVLQGIRQLQLQQAQDSQQLKEMRQRMDTCAAKMKAVGAPQLYAQLQTHLDLGVAAAATATAASSTAASVHFKPLRVLILSPVPESALKLPSEMSELFGALGGLPWDVVLDFGPLQQNAGFVSSSQQAKQFIATTASQYSAQCLPAMVCATDPKGDLMASAVSKDSLQQFLQDTPLRSCCRWLSVGDVLHRHAASNAHAPATCSKAWLSVRSGPAVRAVVDQLIASIKQESEQFSHLALTTVAFHAPAWFPQALDKLVTCLHETWSTSMLCPLRYEIVVVKSALQLADHKETSKKIAAACEELSGLNIDLYVSNVGLDVLLECVWALHNNYNGERELLPTMVPTLMGQFVKLKPELLQDLKRVGAYVLFPSLTGVPSTSTARINDGELLRFLKGGPLSWECMSTNPMGGRYDQQRSSLIGVVDRLSQRPVSMQLTSGAIIDRVQKHVLSSRHTRSDREQLKNVIQVKHEPSAGGTTLCRRLVVTLRKHLPCLALNHTEAAAETQQLLVSVLSRLQAASGLPVLVYLDRCPVPFFEELHHACLDMDVTFLVASRATGGDDKPTKLMHFFVRQRLEKNSEEEKAFRDAFSTFIDASDASVLAALRNADCPMLFGLATFFTEFSDRLQQFLISAIDELDAPGKRLLLFIAFVHHYSNGKRQLHPIFYRRVLTTQPGAAAAAASANGTAAAVMAAPIDIFSTPLLSSASQLVMRQLLRCDTGDQVCRPCVDAVASQLVERLLTPLVAERQFWQKRLLHPSSEYGELGFVSFFVETCCRDGDNTLEITDSLMHQLFIYDFDEGKQKKQARGKQEDSARPLIRDALDTPEDVREDSKSRMSQIFQRLARLMPLYRGDYEEHHGLFLSHRLNNHIAAKECFGNALKHTTVMARIPKIRVSNGFLHVDQLKAAYASLTPADCYTPLHLRFVVADSEVAHCTLFVDPQARMAEIRTWVMNSLHPGGWPSEPQDAHLQCDTDDAFNVAVNLQQTVQVWLSTAGDHSDSLTLAVGQPDHSVASLIADSEMAATQWMTSPRIRSLKHCKDVHWSEVFQDGCKAFDRAREGVGIDDDLVRKQKPFWVAGTGLVKLIVVAMEVALKIYGGDVCEHELVLEVALQEHPLLVAVLRGLQTLPRYCAPEHVDPVQVGEQLLQEISSVSGLMDGLNEADTDVDFTMLELRRKLDGLTSVPSAQINTLSEAVNLMWDKSGMQPWKRVSLVERWLHCTLQTHHCSKVSELPDAELWNCYRQLHALLQNDEALMVITPSLFIHAQQVYRKAAQLDTDETAPALYVQQWLSCITHWSQASQQSNIGDNNKHTFDQAQLNVFRVVMQFPWPPIHAAYDAWCTKLHGAQSSNELLAAVKACEKTGRSAKAAPLAYVGRPDKGMAGLQLLISDEWLQSKLPFSSAAGAEAAASSNSSGSKTSSQELFWDFARGWLLRMEGTMQPTQHGESRIVVPALANEHVFYELNKQDYLPLAPTPCTFFLGFNYKGLTARDVDIADAETYRTKFPDAYMWTESMQQRGGATDWLEGKVVPGTHKPPLYTIKVTVSGAPSYYIFHEHDYFGTVGQLAARTRPAHGESVKFKLVATSVGSRATRVTSTATPAAASGAAKSSTYAGKAKR